MRTSFKSYLRDHLRANLKTLLFITFFALAFTVIIALDGQIVERSYYDDIRYYCTLDIPVTVLCITCYIAPVTEFAFFKKRRNLDCVYALPITRQELGIVHYVSGLITVVVPYTVSYLTNFLLLLRAPEAYNLSPLWGNYFATLLMGICMYSLFAFVFNEGNTKGDGIWFMILWTYVIALVLAAFNYLLQDTVFNGFDAYLGIPLAMASEICMHYTDMVEINEYYDFNSVADLWQESSLEMWFVVWIAIGAASAAGLLMTFGKQRMEKTEEISDSWFGYRMLIPVYAVAGMLLFSVDVSPVLWLIIELLAVVGYTIYRRGFHYKKSDIIILLSLLIFLVL